MKRPIIAGIMYALLIGTSPLPKCEREHETSSQEEAEETVSGCQEIQEEYLRSNQFYRTQLDIESLVYREWSDAVENQNSAVQERDRIFDQIFDLDQQVLSSEDDGTVILNIAIDLNANSIAVDAQNQYVQSIQRLEHAKNRWRQIDRGILNTENILKNYRQILYSCNQ